MHSGHEDSPLTCDPTITAVSPLPQCTFLPLNVSFFVTQRLKDGWLLVVTTGTTKMGTLENFPPSVLRQTDLKHSLMLLCRPRRHLLWGSLLPLHSTGWEPHIQGSAGLAPPWGLQIPVLGQGPPNGLTTSLKTRPLNRDLRSWDLNT